MSNLQGGALEGNKIINNNFRKGDKIIKGVRGPWVVGPCSSNINIK